MKGNEIEFRKLDL